MKTTSLKHRASCFLFIAFAFMYVGFLTSCMSVYTRLEARNEQIPRIYPGTHTNINNIDEMTKTPPSSGRGSGFHNLNYCVTDCLGYIGISDFLFSLALDTVLLPTDLVFGSGRIIATEPSGYTLRTRMNDSAYGAYRAIANDIGVRYSFEPHGHAAQHSLYMYAFTLDSDIEGFARRKQVLYEVRHTNNYWRDANGRRMLTYSVFWLNPRTQKIMFLFLPSDSHSMRYSVSCVPSRQTVPLKKYYSEMKAMEVCETFPAFPKRMHEFWEYGPSNEVINAVAVARDKYREITGEYPDEKLRIFSTGKFNLFDGDKDPPPNSLKNHRIEVLITEPFPPLWNGVLKAKFWIEPTTNANPVVEVLYPIINPDPHSRSLEPKEIADGQNRN